MAKIYYYYDEKEKRKKKASHDSPYKKYKYISYILLLFILAESLGIILWGLYA